MSEEIKLSNGRILRIHQDPCPMNPREEYDNIGTIFHYHDFRPDEFLLAIPVYMYDHNAETWR